MKGLSKLAQPLEKRRRDYSIGREDMARTVLKTNQNNNLKMNHRAITLIGVILLSAAELNAQTPLKPISVKILN